MFMLDAIKETSKVYKRNVDNLIENKDIYIPLLKKLGLYDAAVYDIRKEILDGEKSGLISYYCCPDNCTNLTDEEMQYINELYWRENKKYELEFYWSLNA